MKRKRWMCVIVGGLWCWAVASTGPETPSFLGYYQPIAETIEPNAPGYALPLDPAEVVNWGILGRDVQTAVSSLIEQQGVAVVPWPYGDPNVDDIVDAYRQLIDREIPLFVTVDTWLHLYHVQFDETLRQIEQDVFAGDLLALMRALQDRFAETMRVARFGDPDELEALRRNLGFVTVATKLLDPNAPIPPAVETEVRAELAKIDAHVGFADSDLFIYREDYSQYVPRGHYSRSETLQRYFRAMMWLGRMAFLLKGAENWGPLGEALISVHDARIQTIQGLRLSQALQDVDVHGQTGLETWDRIYTVTAFYVGLADDLTPYDALWAWQQVTEAPAWPQDDPILAYRAALAALPLPRIYGGTGQILVPDPVTDESLNEVLAKTQGVRFMGQRFVPDSYLFQHLVFPSVQDYQGHSPRPFTAGDDGGGVTRGYPRGLDLMAVLGSKRALISLVEAGDTDYVDYWRRFGQMRSEFDALTVDDWHANLYMAWLYALRALVVDKPAGMPAFMQTEAWSRHELNSALASWVQLRHDTILYAKQSYTPGRTAMPRPRPAGFIEPQAEFLRRLLELNRMTAAGLEDLGVLSEKARQRLERLDDLLVQSRDIVALELTGRALGAEAESLLLSLPAQLEQAVEGVDGLGLRTTLVADVHTHGYEQQVLEEATGWLDLMVVACPAADGSVYLAAGPVLSTYEFKQPMSDRLTDEAWRHLLTERPPARPAWVQPLVQPVVPLPLCELPTRR